MEGMSAEALSPVRKKGAALLRVPQMRRITAIHDQLKRGRYPSLKSLTESLEVNRRTVQRDLQHMRDERNLPIEYSAERGGYFYTGEVADIPGIPMGEQELFALLIAERAVESFVGTSYHAPLRVAMTKLYESLNSECTYLVDSSAPLVVFRGGSLNEMVSELFRTVSRAITQRRVLKILYRSPYSEETLWRSIEPYQLCCIRGKWYLFGWDHLRRASRTFVLQRIQQTEILDDRFRFPEHFSTDEYLRYALNAFRGDDLFHVVLDFDREVAHLVKEGNWQAEQKLEDLDGGRVRLSFPQTNLFEVKTFVLGWGEHVTVREPAELREEIRAAAEKILQRHAPDGVGD